MNREPDWALWRSFSSVVANGSLSGAARELGISQPTVGRHIETLEADLGLVLFERSLSGLKPNVTALRIYEPVAQAQSALAEAAIMAAGAQDDLGGTVRITASAVISNYVLPAMLVRKKRRLPVPFSVTANTSRFNASTSSAAKRRRAADMPSANTVCRLASGRRAWLAMVSAATNEKKAPAFISPWVERQPA